MSDDEKNNPHMPDDDGEQNEVIEGEGTRTGDEADASVADTSATAATGTALVATAENQGSVQPLEAGSAETQTNSTARNFTQEEFEAGMKRAREIDDEIARKMNRRLQLPGLGYRGSGVGLDEFGNIVNQQQAYNQYPPEAWSSLGQQQSATYSTPFYQHQPVNTSLELHGGFVEHRQMVAGQTQKAQAATKAASKRVLRESKLKEEAEDTQFTPIDCDALIDAIDNLEDFLFDGFFPLLSRAAILADYEPDEGLVESIMMITVIGTNKKKWTQRRKNNKRMMKIKKKFGVLVAQFKLSNVDISEHPGRLLAMFPEITLRVRQHINDVNPQLLTPVVNSALLTDVWNTPSLFALKEALDGVNLTEHVRAVATVFHKKEAEEKERDEKVKQSVDMHASIVASIKADAEFVGKMKHFLSRN